MNVFLDFLVLIKYFSVWFYCTAPPTHWTSSLLIFRFSNELVSVWDTLQGYCCQRVMWNFSVFAYHQWEQWMRNTVYQFPGYRVFSMAAGPPVTEHVNFWHVLKNVFDGSDCFVWASHCTVQFDTAAKCTYIHVPGKTKILFGDLIWQILLKRHKTELSLKFNQGSSGGLEELVAGQRCTDTFDKLCSNWRKPAAMKRLRWTSPSHCVKTKPPPHPYDYFCPCEASMGRL